MTEFKIPELGENVASGDVTRVLVNVGDTIAHDQPVVELETDKATIEVPSSVAGVVKEIKVKKGDKVKVGAVVLTVDAPSDGGAAKPSAPAPAAAPAAPEPPQPAAAAPAPAAAPPAPAAAPGPPRVVPMPVRSAPEAAPPVVPAKVDGERGPAVPASPGVRRLAREIGVDINSVQGSGPGGRITQEDVKEHARRILSSVGSAGAAGPVMARGGRPLPDFQKWGEIDRQPWSNIRRATAEHLSYAWTTIPHVTQFDKADVGEMEELRKHFKEKVAKAGGNLTITAMLVRVLATAVKKFPQFNASIDTERGEVVYKKYVNIGVAVDTDRGLLVPVIREADTKNIMEIAVELQRLAERARDKKLSLEEMSGGGITISNLGGIGGTYFTPIVNWPEVAILGVSRGTTEPVWKDGHWEPRQMLPLSLSYDHRVIDGADAMRFLRWVVEAIEQPFLLSLVG
ncbi:MAG TPA: 2-oxo acid dehydrogenase subunit E2 [Vicinamibacterales bacterium]|nr:2-oxo acid dehydrogenase subunit E2 [Vicinamibacterales bacterium]